MRTLPSAALSLLVAGQALLSAQSVLVVDDDGGLGVSFTEIQPAIDAASPGDTVLVKPGLYASAASITIRAKALSLVGDASGTTFLDARLVVEDLAPADAVRIQQLHVAASPSTAAFAILVRDCAGSVVVEDSSLLGASFDWTDGMVITDAAAVTVARCTVRGRDMALTTIAGIDVTRSRLYAFDASIEGGNGTFALGFPFSAGPGLDIEDAFAYLQGCVVRGGSGAFWFQLGCRNGGPGGAGAVMRGASSRLELLDTTLRGGSGGSALPPCSSGPPGPATSILGGTVRNLPGSALSLAASSPARERESVTFRITGHPGHPAWLVVGLPSAPAYLPAFGGPLLLDTAALIVLPVGVLPAAGSLAVATRVPLLAPGTPVGTLLAQAFSFDPATGLRAGSGQTLVLLDGAF